MIGLEALDLKFDKDLFFFVDSKPNLVGVA